MSKMKAAHWSAAKQQFYMPKVCPWCHKHHGVKATEKQFMDWEDGMLIQKAFPDHTAAQRDALLVGICKDCHERIY